jgi:hypothetical protein
LKIMPPIVWARPGPLGQIRVIVPALEAAQPLACTVVGDQAVTSPFLIAVNAAYPDQIRERSWEV